MRWFKGSSGGAPKNQHTVFISHAHADNVLCDPYAKALSDLGLDVWYDRTNMEYAQLISDVIGHELQRRSAFVVFLTPSAVASAWVQLEIATYLSYWTKDHERRVILPVMLSDCEVPPMLHSFKRVDVSLMSQDEVVDAISRTLGVEPPERQPIIPDDDYDSNYDVHDYDAAFGTASTGSATDQIVADWLEFVREKWRAVSDGQLGWRPLRGRWNGWDEIYRDVHPRLAESEKVFLNRRFESAKDKGAAASAVVSFIHDLEALRMALEKANTDSD